VVQILEKASGKCWQQPAPASEIMTSHLVQVFGPGHLDVAASRLSVAQTYKELNRHLDAMEEYQAAHDIKLQILGDDHEDVTGLRERMESLRPMLVTPRGESQQDSNGQS